MSTIQYDFLSILRRISKFVLQHRCQFHHHFTCAFFANILAPKYFKPKTQLCNFWHKNVGANARVKCAHKMLIKQTPGVNFINVVRTSFWQLFQLHVCSKSCQNVHLYKKFVCLTLMKGRHKTDKIGNRNNEYRGVTVVKLVNNDVIRAWRSN